MDLDNDGAWLALDANQQAVQFQPVDVPSDQRDVWLTIRAIDKEVRGRRVPIPDQFHCHDHGRPRRSDDYVTIHGMVGVSAMIGVECFHPLVEGARYEIVVHWKTTPSESERVPEGLFVGELVSEPIVYTHLSLYEKVRSPKARMKQAGLRLARVRSFLNEIVRLQEAKNWNGLCSLTSKPFLVNSHVEPDGRRDRVLNTQAECEKLMPFVCDGADFEPIHRQGHPQGVPTDPLEFVEEMSPGIFRFMRIRFSGICPNGMKRCVTKDPTIIGVATRGMSDANE